MRRPGWWRVPGLVAMLSWSVACHKKAETRTVEGPGGPVRVEVRRPEGAGDPGVPADSPARRASLQVVAEGRERHAKGQLERALRLFEEALNLDGGNGVACYWVARTYVDLGRRGPARGMLDRARTLLAGDSSFQGQLRELEERLERGGRR